MATTIRAAVPADWTRLSSLEREHFAELSNGGRWFRDGSLQPVLPSGTGWRRSYVSVVEVAGVVEGFALAFAYSLPGTGEWDASNMLLQYIAISEGYRRRGLGRQLLEHVESRIASERQNVMFAHIPASEAEFYRSVGWQVAPREHGFAWVPFNDAMRADAPIRGSDYEHVAAKLLRPRAIRRTFEFPSVTNSPVTDAMSTLEELLARGEIDLLELDSDTVRVLLYLRSQRR